MSGSQRGELKQMSESLGACAEQGTGRGVS